MIVARIAHLCVDALRVPERERLLEFDAHALRMWFAVPRMDGGFSDALHADGDATTLVSASGSRVADGSRHRHAITMNGCTLVEAGFG